MTQTNSTPPMLSLVALKDEESLPLPDKGPYYVATQQGYYLHDSNMFGRYLIPIKENLSLPKIESPFMWHDIPKLPIEILGQAWKFFYDVFKEQHTEAMVDITWTKADGFRLFIPEQTCSFSGVKCDRNPTKYKAQLVGTIHSHCDFDAFHSGTDETDASQHDGLHITIGNVDDDKPSIAIMVARDGHTWDFELDDITDGDLVKEDYPAWWVHKVEVQKYTLPKKTTSPTTAIVAQYPKVGGGKSYSYTATYFTASSLAKNSEIPFDTEALEILKAVGDEIDLITDMLARMGITMMASFKLNKNDHPKTPPHTEYEDERALPW